MANVSKKFALLSCSMMTMQALRLIISTAGFCVVRFHIDCSLFNIFISRLVNAVMMSQLFGNWLGDLIVFAAGGHVKLYAVMLANWAEFTCFCTALYCICHTECGHLTGFYWSMVMAYFWWKVSEAPCTSIAATQATDYYFAGFTLSGVWAAILKWVVMQFVSDVGTNTLHFQSDALGDVNVKVVGARSVKTTVDYRAAKWLFITTIVLTALMCLAWTLIPALVEDSGDAKGVIKETVENMAVAIFVGFSFGGILAVPGAMLGAGMGWVFGKCCCLGQKWCQLIFGIVGALGGIVGVTAPVGWKDGTEADQEWVEKVKWPSKWKDPETWAPVGGLGVGLVLGALTGVIIGACTGSKKRGFWAGAFIGSFFGLWLGEIVNAAVTEGKKKKVEKRTAKQWGVVVCGFLIVVLGLGTVYSIYPGMAPCSITQFKYFNIIDILILILSAIAPLVIMGLDLAANETYTLGKTIASAFEPGGGVGTAWMAMGVVFLIATLVCEGIVLNIMQHPFSKMAKDVTNSGWRAVTLTVTMVTSQLTSTSVGFACVAAGSMFNDGIMNMNSTGVLWTIECTGVLGEGYLTELKKYESGKWPTQGMGKWASHKWWRNKAFGNAWAIWCCIGTTDLRRDIMLCRQ